MEMELPQKPGSPEADLRLSPVSELHCQGLSPRCLGSFLGSRQTWAVQRLLGGPPLCSKTASVFHGRILFFQIASHLPAPPRRVFPPSQSGKIPGGFVPGLGPAHRFQEPCHPTRCCWTCAEGCPRIPPGESGHTAHCWPLFRRDV